MHAALLMCATIHIQACLCITKRLRLVIQRMRKSVVELVSKIRHCKLGSQLEFCGLTSPPLSLYLIISFVLNNILLFPSIISHQQELSTTIEFGGVVLSLVSERRFGKGCCNKLASAARGGEEEAEEEGNPGHSKKTQKKKTQKERNSRGICARIAGHVAPIVHPTMGGHTSKHVEMHVARATSGRVCPVWKCEGAATCVLKAVVTLNLKRGGAARGHWWGQEA